MNLRSPLLLQVSFAKLSFKFKKMHLPRVMARFYSNNISVDIAKKSFISNKLRKTQCHFRWVARFALNYCSTLLRAFFRESSYNGIFINATHDIRSVSCFERQRCTLV